MAFLLLWLWPYLIVAFGLGAALGWLVRRALADVARKRDLPDLSYYMLRADVVTPDLSAYARWTDLPDVSGFVTEDALARYAQTSELPDLSAYVRSEDFEGLVTDLSRFALKTDVPRVPDLTRYALKSAVPAIPDLSRFALRSEVPRLPDLSEFVRRDEVPPPPDLSGLASKTDLAALADRRESANGHGHAVPVDLALYARKDDLPDVSAFVSEKEVRALLQEKDREIAELREHLVRERAARTEDVARLETRLGLEAHLIRMAPKSRLRRAEAMKPRQA